MNTGEHRWSKAIGPASDFVKNHPDLRTLRFDFANMGQFGIRPSPLLTKTLLVYALTAGGTNNGPRLVAYDKATGTELASADLPGAAIGTPMTYQVDGRQYIAITVQGRTSTDVPELIALALP